MTLTSCQRLSQMQVKSTTGTYTVSNKFFAKPNAGQNDVDISWSCTKSIEKAYCNWKNVVCYSEFVQRIRNLRPVV